MAIYYLTASIHTRGKGHSAVNGAAYRARCEIMDERTGERRDYSRHDAGSVLFEGIYAPKGAPEWATDRGQLWNQVERVEKRSDAQLYRSFVIALPHELTLEQNRRLLQDFVRENFSRKGFVADVVIHGPDKEGSELNIHAHVAVPLRQLEGDEFSRKKERDATIGERKEKLEIWREDWEKIANRHLERAGLDVRIDRRSLAEQGIEREPTYHLGPDASAMERQGKPTRLGALNREITADNTKRPQRLRELETQKLVIEAAIAAERVTQTAQRLPSAGVDSRQPHAAREVSRQTVAAPKGIERPAAQPAQAARKAGLRTAKGIEREAQKPLGTGVRAGRGLLGGLARAAESILEGLFGGGEPVLTPQQAKRTEAAAKERAQERVAERTEAQKQADLDDLLSQIARNDAQRRLRRERGEELDQDRGIERER